MDTLWSWPKRIAMKRVQYHHHSSMADISGPLRPCLPGTWAMRLPRLSLREDAGMSTRFVDFLDAIGSQGRRY